MDRRQFALGSLFVAAALPSSLRVKASTNDTAEHPSSKPAPGSAFSAKGRPAPSRRTFVSPAVEDEILRLKAAVRNPRLATLIETCYPNTLDTTIDIPSRHTHSVRVADPPLAITIALNGSGCTELHGFDPVVGAGGAAG